MSGCEPPRSFNQAHWTSPNMDRITRRPMREAPAMAALDLLGERIVTLSCSRGPGDGHRCDCRRSRDQRRCEVPIGSLGYHDLKLSVRSAPRYGQLLRALEDYVPLWQAGVRHSASTSGESADPMTCWHALETIHDRPPLRGAAPVRGYRSVRWRRSKHDGGARAAIMLRAGPDPAISCADGQWSRCTFASRNGLIVVRGTRVFDRPAGRAEAGGRAIPRCVADDRAE